MAHNIDRARNISKSMISYLKRARDYKEFLLKETQEFERGKRHLANMMGVKSEEMTQNDIDDAIRYLFPSGLFDPRARPKMQHPKLIYKAQKDAQFDIEGRPNHFLFYTAMPNYCQAIIDIRRQLNKLNKFEDEQLANGILDSSSESMYHISDRAWLTHDELSEKFIERISDGDYQYFIRCLEKLRSHPYSIKSKALLDLYTREKIGQKETLHLPEIIRNEETGEIYTELIERRREHKVWVKTVLNGTGKIQIENHDILYFVNPYYRTSLLMPLRMSGMQDKVDIFAKVVYRPHDRDPMHYGQSAVAGAIRAAVGRTLGSYVDPEVRERLRLAGLLERDMRLKERKKFGQMKARRKYTWKKR